MAHKGNYYASWRDDMEIAPTKAQLAQEECARDPAAYFERLGRLSRLEAASTVIERFSLDVDPDELLDLWERWTASCVRIGATKANNIVRFCPCDACVELKESARARLGGRWRSILDSDTLSVQDGPLKDKRKKWTSKESYAYSKPQSHREANKASWTLRRLHAQILGVSPQAVTKDGKIIAGHPKLTQNIRNDPDE